MFQFLDKRDHSEITGHGSRPTGLGNPVLDPDGACRLPLPVVRPDCFFSMVFSRAVFYNRIEATFLPAEVQAMRYWLSSIAFLGALAALAFLAPAAAAQNVEKVRIKTVDGVDLSGRFYPGKGDTPTVVMLLHGFKENSNSKEWKSLAEGLQKKHFAVLTFDFRGFGSGATTVDPALFWAPENRLNQMIRAGKESISSKEFRPAYYPALINDIAAAKAFLDRRNDGNAGGARCNSSNLVLIGSREGATLGAIWLNSEWHRYKVKMNALGQPQIQNGFGGVVQGVADTQQPPAGSGVVGAVWLSINPKLLGPGVPPLSLESILLTPAKKQFVPMAFMYGEEDLAAKKIARSLEPKLVVYKKLKEKGKKTREDKYKFTGEWPIPKTKLEGAGLLQEGLETVDKIGEYIDEIVQAKSNEWVEQDFRKTPYVWVNGAAGANLVLGQLIKRPSDLHLQFSDYGKFMGR
jgi:hypothetical protein